MRFVALDDPALCPRCGVEAPRGSETLVVGYGALDAVLAAHRRHACAHVFLLLVATAGRASFAQLPAVSALDAAAITAREADVLVLLLAGASGPQAARRLCLAPATVRAHARALLRKLGAPDRMALRASLLPGAGVFQPSRASNTTPTGSFG